MAVNGWLSSWTAWPEVKESQARNTTLIGRMVRRSLISDAAIPAMHQTAIVQRGCVRLKEVFDLSNKKIWQAGLPRLHPRNDSVTGRFVPHCARHHRHAEMTREFTAVGAQDDVGRISHDLGFPDASALVVVIFSHGDPQGCRCQ